MCSRAIRRVDLADPVFLPDGGVTTPKGFVAGAVYAGIKTYSKDKMDLGVLMSEVPCHVAGTYTLNEIKSGSLVLTKERVEGGRVRAVTVSSGIANAVVEAGRRDALELLVRSVCLFVGHSSSGGARADAQRREDCRHR